MASTTEPRRSPSSGPSRRTLLASAALVAPATLLPAIAAEEERSPNLTVPQAPDPHPAPPDAELLALARAYDAAEAIVNAPVLGSREAADRHRAAEAECLRLAERMGPIPATTPAGMAAKLRVAWLVGLFDSREEQGPHAESRPDRRMLWNAMRDAEAIARLAGEGRA